MKSFRPDFTKVRVAPPPPEPPWRQFETTWEDILDEIGDKALTEGLNEPTKHEAVDTRLKTLEKELAKTARLALSNQHLIEKMSENQTALFKLIEQHFGGSSNGK